MIKIKDTLVCEYDVLPYVKLEVTAMLPPPEGPISQLSLLKNLQDELDQVIREQEVNVAREIAKAEVRKAVSGIEEEYDLKLKVTI